MSEEFFAHPILNSPHQYPGRHWELDENGHPTQQVIEPRHRADFITPFLKPRKIKGSKAQQQGFSFDFAEMAEEDQRYDRPPLINNKEVTPLGGPEVVL